jgi:hypothetical protein
MKLDDCKQVRIVARKIGHVETKTDIDDHGERNQPMQRHGHAAIARDGICNRHDQPFWR